MATLAGSVKSDEIISPVTLSLLNVCGRRIMGTPTRSDLPPNTSMFCAHAVRRQSSVPPSPSLTGSVRRRAFPNDTDSAVGAFVCVFLLCRPQLKPLT